MIFKRLPKQYIREHFTHKGWLYLCPVYVDFRDKECPSLSERNWIPGWWLEFNTYMHQTINMVGMALSPRFEPCEFPLWLEPLED